MISPIQAVMKYRNHLRYKHAMKKVEKLTIKQEKAQKKLDSYKVFERDYRLFNNYFQYFGRRLTNLLARVFYIYPVKNNRILFMSFEADKFACNPKYLSEYIKENYPGQFEIVWAFRNKNKFRWLEDWDYKVVQMYSVEFFKYVLTSRVVVYNMRMHISIPYRKKQTIIGTGHGGGAYKKLLLDNPKITRLEKKQISLANKVTDIYISSCAAYTEKVVRGAFGHKGEVMECGMPRNDVLVNGQLQRAEAVRRYYGIPKENKILMYAPTYRKGTRWASDYNINMEEVVKAAKERFGGEWTVFFRLHYFIKQDLVTNMNVDFIDATNYSDMQELLMATDLLITDYSSSVWDYALLKRPGVLYATDLEEYEVQQGFYTSIDKWPFPVTRNNRELVECIRNFDMDACKEKIRNHFEMLDSKENGTATKVIAERIYKECFGGAKE